MRVEDNETINGKYNGIKVYIANTTNKQMIFRTDLGNLEMVMQALDRQGNWRDIERVPYGSCGNEFYNVSLDANKFWVLTAPVYKGEFKTKLRISLKYLPNGKEDGEFIDSYRDSDKETIYSNTFDGSINPAQFWRDKSNHDAYLMPDRISGW